MAERLPSTGRPSTPFRRRWLRLAAWFAVAALGLDLLTPLLVLAETVPADDGAYICHSTAATPANAPAPDAPLPAGHGGQHCPLCLVLAGGVVAPPSATPVALPLPVRVQVQPYRTAATVPSAAEWRTLPPSRAPPMA